ncbi:MAG: sulfotransferase domain-containing protein [Verrucomicrobia bacterium]|nr:sulfotransferase domain-containing protein [Verrucomicrobiota bacterium]MCH8511788.1 sulfotransferase domain-containing protein [Kiritimatiellia bacterium]
MKSYSQLVHDFKRFGFTPAKLPLRFQKGNAPVVLANSVPKSGTHLLESLLVAHPRLYRKLIPTLHMGNLPGRPGGLEGVLGKTSPGVVLVTHLRHQPDWEALVRERNLKHLLMVRDPRDVAISGIHYICKNKHHHLHRVFSALPDSRSRLVLFIEGSEAQNVPSLSDRFSNYLPWLNTPCLMVRFEDLVGPAGGGEPQMQIDTVSAIFRHLGYPLTESEIGQLAASAFSTASPTYRKGKVQQWREHFDDELTACFRDRAGHLLEALGYPD